MTRNFPAGRRPYVGRFAPSPSGPLHAGSLATALASWLDARAHGGRWLVRIEDIDTQRCSSVWVPEILRQLSRCGLEPDEPPVWQSHRTALYEKALSRLASKGLTYACTCTRHDIRAALSLRTKAPMNPESGEIPYPGTCRDLGRADGPGCAIRLRCGTDENPLEVDWTDRRLGPQHQNVTREVGDFVLKRRDGLWAYQLAVVVDDADQRVTHIVRGEDLVSNTARQITLQTLLDDPQPSYLHTPLVLDESRRKLSKHNGAPAVKVESDSEVRLALQSAIESLGFSLPHSTWHQTSIADILSRMVVAWTQPDRGT